MKLLSLVLLAAVGCAQPNNPSFTVTVPVTREETVKKAEEAAIDNVRADLGKLPDFPARPLLKEEVSPEDGILISPRYAAEASLNAAEAERYSTETAVLKRLKEQEDKLNEAYTKRLEKDLATCKKKSWWDRHGNETMLGAGVAAGILVSLGVFSAAVKIKE